MPNQGVFYYLSFLFGLIFCLLTSCATVPEDTSGRVEVQDENVGIEIVFNEKDSHLIREYYRHHLKKMPPGLAKRKRLPPGLEKQIVRNGTLPPGLRSVPLPYELERQLTPLPGGYIRIRIGGDVVLLEEPTRVVIDILYDVTR